MSQVTTLAHAAIDVELGAAGFRVPATTVPTRRHTDHHILVWQARGTSTYLVDGHEYLVGADEAIWIHAGAEHEFTVHEDSVALPMFFMVDEIATTLRSTSLVRIDAASRLLCLVLLQSQNSIIRPPMNVQRQVLGRIEQATIASSALVMPTSPAARAVAEAIRLNPGDNRRVEEWASAVHTSSRTLERAFRAETGVTLREWRRTRRLEAAAVLLRDGSSVASVARRVGYDDQSAFGRVFRAHYGTTPSAFAASHETRTDFTSSLDPEASDPTLAPVTPVAPVASAGDVAPAHVRTTDDEPDRRVHLDRTDPSDDSDRTDPSDRTDRSDRRDRTNLSDRSDRTDRTDLRPHRRHLDKRIA